VHLYLFVLDDRPTYRTDLQAAQLAINERLSERHGVSDVWWSEDNPYVPRVYLYGATHLDHLAAEEAGEDVMDADISWEEQDQLIWPVEIEPNSVPINPSPLDPSGTQMTLSVTTSTEKAELTRVVPSTEWYAPTSDHGKMIFMFAAEAAHGVAGALRSKEGS